MGAGGLGARTPVLADSKTGRKTVILNAPALAVLAGLDRLGSYVVPGDNPRSRVLFKRPWQAVAKHAGLEGVRLTIFGIPMRASVLVAASLADYRQTVGTYTGIDGHTIRTP